MGASGDPVADAGHGLDERGLAEFAAQSGHGHAQDVGEGVEVFVPRFLQQPFGGLSLKFRADPCWYPQAKRKTLNVAMEHPTEDILPQ